MDFTGNSHLNVQQPKPDNSPRITQDLSEILANVDVQSLQSNSSIKVNVNVAPGNTSSMSVSGPEHTLKNNLDIKMQGDVLKIGTTGSFATTQANSIEVNVCLPQLNSIKSMGSGDIVGEINQDDIKLSLQGSGDFNLKGQVNSLQANLAGSGDMKLESLLCKNAVVLLQGSGDVSVQPSQSINATLQGVGDINIYGNPVEQKQRIQGMGDINKKPATLGAKMQNTRTDSCTIKDNKPHI